MCIFQPSTSKLGLKDDQDYFIMKSFTGLFFLLFCIWSCDFHETQTSKDCIYSATVVDLTGMDGCGFVFQLDNGDYLEPVWRWGWCGTPPLPEGATEDPLWNFDYVDGQRVRLGYETAEEGGSICMVGEQVYVTCLEVIGEEAVSVRIE